MARPTVDAATEAVYRRVPGYVRDDDADLDYPALRWLSLIGDQLGDLWDLIARFRRSTTRIEAEDPTVTQVGAWASFGAEAGVVGTRLSSAAVGAELVIAFDAPGPGSWLVEVDTRTANNRGIAEVYVDGVLVGLVDEYSAATVTDVRASFLVDLSAAGRHVIRYRRSGNKNPASAGTQVGIDAVELHNLDPVLDIDSDLVDPVEADSGWLDWLGSLVGIPRADLTVDQYRTALAGSSGGRYAGTPTGIAAVLAALLPSGYLHIAPNYTSPFRIGILRRVGESTNAAVYAAALPHRPAGFDFVVDEGITWAEDAALYPTWAEFDAAGTWAAEIAAP